MIEESMIPLSALCDLVSEHVDPHERPNAVYVALNT